MFFRQVEHFVCIKRSAKPVLHFQRTEPAALLPLEQQPAHLLPRLRAWDFAVREGGAQAVAAAAFPAAEEDLSRALLFFSRF